MWRWNKKPVFDGNLQLVEKEIFEALKPSAAEIEAAASSPFFYRRLRVLIEAESRRRAEAGKEWLTWLVAARQAAPALALVALLAAGAFWTSWESTLPNGGAEATANLLVAGDVSHDELVTVLAGWDSERERQ